MTNRAFWQQVYIAAVKAGKDVYEAKRIADQAYQDLISNTYMLRP